jgi:hypothetical protein
MEAWGLDLKLSAFRRFDSGLADKGAILIRPAPAS